MGYAREAEGGYDFGVVRWWDGEGVEGKGREEELK